MIKKTAVVLIISCLFISFSTQTSYCMFFNLTGDQIDEAIEYGAKNRRMDLKGFIKPWVSHLGEKDGWATLYTAYHNIAFKSKKAAVERRELSQGEILRALQIKENLTFTVSVFGDYMEFARGYNAVLFCDEETLYPIYTYFPEFAEPSKFYPESPVYVAGCVFKFPKEDISPDSEITLMVTSPDGVMLKFGYDLSKVK